MENQLPENDGSPDNVIYPPKYIAAHVSDNAALVRSIYSILLYFAIGFLLIRRLDILVVLIAVIFMHEMGHFIAMKRYDYSDVSIFFIPLFGALVSGSKREVSQRETAVILLAGPLPGILLGLILYFIDQNQGGISLGNISLNFISLLLIWVNALNLVPVFPLDGAQLLNRVFLNEEGVWSNVFIMLSAAVVVWLAMRYKIYVLLIVPLVSVFRYISSIKYNHLEKKLLEAGIDLDRSYDELSDREYWSIRKVIVQNKAAFANVHPGPPFSYDSKEDQIAQEVETALQRNLLMDITIAQKFVVIIVWGISLASPWLFGIEFIGRYF